MQNPNGLGFGTNYIRLILDISIKCIKRNFKDKSQRNKQGDSPGRGIKID
jgi:hypothetical protein